MKPILECTPVLHHPGVTHCAMTGRGVIAFICVIILLVWILTATILK